MIEQAITDTGANVLFGVLVIGIFAVAMAALMFAGLLLRGVWRSRVLTRAREKFAAYTWRDAIVAAESHALAGARNKSRALRSLDTD